MINKSRKQRAEDLADLRYSEAKRSRCLHTKIAVMVDARELYRNAAIPEMVDACDRQISETREEIAKQSPKISIYQAMLNAGVQIDNHSSDLYVPDNDKTRAILRVYEQFRPMNASTFTSEIDGERWLDIPFAFDPWWEAIASK